MKKLLTLIFLTCSLSAFCQVNNIYQSGGISQTVGAPTYRPGAKGNIVAIDTVTGTWYVSRDRNSVNWLAMGDRIESISGCSAPNYTPNKYNSELVINNCGAPTYATDFPKLYQHVGAGTWVCLNCSSGATYTAGAGIAIDGSNVISNTGVITEVDGSTTNELQNLSLSGQALSISGGTGATLPIVGVSAGTGIGVSTASGVATVTNSSPSLWTDGGATSYLTSTTDNVAIGGTSATAALHVQQNGALSQPIFKTSGTWITGGTATTTKPAILIEPSAATSTSWSTSGTGFGINAASGFVGKIADFQLNGTSLASLSYTGDMLINGVTAGKGLASVATNTAFGVSALAANTTGSENTAIGNRALKVTQGGGANTALGSRVLEANVSGGNNVGIGIAALNANTNGNSNMAIGFQCLKNATSPGTNVAIGASVMQNGTGSPSNNVAIGTYSMLGATGNNNVAIGLSAMQSITSGGNNVAIGYEAGFSGTTRSNGVFIGYQAGYSETASNRLYIDNSNTATPLIGGDFTNDRVGINVAPGSIDASAKLEISSTTGGVLFPRMTTTQRDAISSPADGLVIYNTTAVKLQVRAGGAWVDLH